MEIDAGFDATEEAISRNQFTERVWYKFEHPVPLRTLYLDQESGADGNLSRDHPNHGILIVRNLDERLWGAVGHTMPCRRRRPGPLAVTARFLRDTSRGQLPANDWKPGSAPPRPNLTCPPIH